MDTEDFARQLENVRPSDVQYDRGSFWVIMAILGWYAFWHVADANAQSPYAHCIAWIAIGLAVWFASNY